MSGESLVLDTNVALFLLRGDNSAADAIFGQRVVISFITYMELLSKPGMTRAETKQVTAFVNEWPMIELDARILEEAIRLRKTYRLKIPDAIVAATALTQQIPLLTADTDFERIKDEVAVLMYEV
jgi:predicted nucleic acid-binding protein